MSRNIDQSPPAFSIPKQHRTILDAKTRLMVNVGPGAYTPDHMKSKTRPPNFTMGRRLKLGSSLSHPSLFTPDPTAYTPKIEAYKTVAPAFKIGNGQRTRNYDSRKAELVPGPNLYQIKSQLWDKPPRFAMGVTLKYDSVKKFKENIPAPGFYDSQPLKLKQQTPQFTMGAKLKSLLIKTDKVPGPGAYSTPNIHQTIKFNVAPSFKFQQSKRPEIGKTKDEIPGPGTYKIKAKFADVPLYSQALPTLNEI